MPTDVQKNFRKQMREFEEQQKGKGREKFYSYIEGDFISNYYEERKKRRRRIISGASIISLIILIWNIYAGSTWVNYIAYKITGKPLISREMFGEVSGGSLIEEIFDTKAGRRRAIYEYLDAVKDVNLDMTALNAVIRYVENPNLSNAVLSGVKELEDKKNDVSEFLIILNSMSVPAEMEGYHKALTRKVELYLDMVEIMAKAFDNMNLNLGKLALSIEEQRQLVQEINAKGEAFNHYNQLERRELIKAFEEAGVKYEIEDDRINYYRD